ncbi:MAG: radical SAM protein [Candidatus Korobacteraceae bacterium]
MDPESLERRCGAIRKHLMPLSEPRTGIGEKVSDPYFGPALWTAMGKETAKYSPIANGLVFNDEPQGEANGELPDAILFHSTDLPGQITMKLEPTTRCNFQCEFCYGRYLKQTNLSQDGLIEVLDHVPGLRSVELTGEGEPLMVREIFEFLHECRKRSLWTHITCNGSMLTEKNVRRLLATGLNSLAVSLESLNPERFARIRPGGRLEQVLKGIGLVESVRHAERIPLATQLWVTILRDTVAEIPNIVRFGAEAGIDTVGFQFLNPMASYRRFYPPALMANLLSAEEAGAIISDPGTPAETAAALAGALRIYWGKTCGIFMSTVMADAEGRVSPCCLLKPPDYAEFGNLKSQSLEDIWRNPRFERFRFALQHGIVLRSCTDCPYVASA